MRTPTRSKKVLLSLCALGSAGAIAGLGTFATFTSTTTASQDVTAGKVAIALGADGVANRLSVDATNVVAGDTINRVVDLVSTSTDPLASVKLTTTAPTVTSVLDTDTTTGLTMYIRKCSVAWTEAGISPAYTYTCSGTASDVLGTSGSPVNIITTTAGGVTLNNLTATTSGSATDRLLITVSLPAANTSANLATPPSSTILYSFTGTQRTATNR